MCKDLDGLLEETFMMPTYFEENEFNDIINEELDSEKIRFIKLIRDAHQSRSIPRL